MSNKLSQLMQSLGIEAPNVSYDLAAGKAGYEQYLADYAAEDKRYSELNDRWYKVLGFNFFKKSKDSTPGTELSEYYELSRKHLEDSDWRPNDDWSEEQKTIFGDKYARDKLSAKSYGYQINSSLKQSKKQDKAEDIAEWSKKNAANGVAASVASLGVNFVGGLRDTGMNTMEYLGTGEVREKDKLSWTEVANAMQSGVAENLNEKYGTIEGNGVFGGKGWGDVYGLGMSIGQSMMAGATGGVGMASMFGMAASNATNDALARGVSSDKAMAIGAVAGAAEMLLEKVSFEKVAGIASKEGVQNALVNMLKQAGRESLEEGFTSVINEFADRWIAADKSNYQLLVNQLIASGMTPEEAKRQAGRQIVNGIIYDTIGGAVSGAVTGAGATAINRGVNQFGLTKDARVANKNALESLTPIQNDLIAEGKQHKTSEKVATKMENKLAKGKELSGYDLRTLAYETENAARTDDVETTRKAIVEKMKAEGLSDAKAKRLGEIALNKAIGHEVSKLQEVQLKNNEIAKEVYRQISKEGMENDSADSEWARQTPIAELREEFESQNTKFDENVLKSSKKNGTIEATKINGGNENGNQERVYLRDSGKWDGGKNTEGQVSRMESRSGQAERRQETDRIADREAARIVNEGRKVSTSELGIKGGSTEQTVRLVARSKETSSMKNARKEAEARGVKVKFFAGDNLNITDDAGNQISARAYIKGKNVYVRADHPLYTSEQLMRHELGHDKIAKGEVDIKAVRSTLVKKVGKENIDRVAELYNEAYAGTGMTAEEIWEECICDSLGEMNIFASDEMAGELFDKTLPEISKAAKSTKSSTQTRGSPNGKASRGTYTESQYNNFGWVRANDVINEGYWDNFTRNYADAVYTKGFDRITPDGEYMIEIYDQNLEERLQAIDHIVFAKGDIKNPNVTRIIQIYEVDETKLDKYRGNIYDFERRGIPQEAGELLELHRKIDFGAYDQESYGRDVSRYSKRLGTERGASSSKTQRIKEYIFEAEESKVSGKASRELDTKSSYAPTFYSHMSRVIDGIKSEKMGVNDIVPYLKGRGVKDEEIKWSGIEAFLEGKKSVTKAELQEFVAGSQLQIEEEMGTDYFDIVKDGDNYIVKGKNGAILENWTYDEGARIWVSDEDGTAAPGIASIRKFAQDLYGSDATRWGEYKLDGGTNYRELVFKMPNSTYTNRAMQAHWGDTKGVLAHTRIQDMTTSEGKKMLFIEEIQSDWHNAGNKSGYVDLSKKVTFNNTTVKHEKGRYRLYRGDTELYANISDEALKTRFPNGITEEQIHQGLVDKHNGDLSKAGGVDDAPFRNTYHEYVLKRLLRMAAEEGYDSIGWTTADIQSERWSDEYAEGYRIEYDQDIPKFLRKYGKKWGATVGQETLNEGVIPEDVLEMIAELERDIDENRTKMEGLNEGDGYWLFLQDGIDDMQATIDRAKKPYAGVTVWSMPITDSMKDSVLLEGQPKFSRELDTTYLSAVKRGDMETAQRMVDEAAKKAGYNYHVYHGTDADFTEFDLRKFGGVNGKGEGYGIYLAANREISAPYGKNVIDSYTKFNRLAEGRKKTLSYSEVKKLVKRSCERDAQRAVEDGEYDTVSEALKDTWVSNYVYTYDYSSMDRVYTDVADMLWKENDNDGDIINELMTSSGAHYDYNNALNFYESVLTPATGIDGFHYIWGNKDGSGVQNDIYLAFYSNQIKSADPVTYDDKGNVIPLSERFNKDNNDIRYSRETKPRTTVTTGQYEQMKANLSHSKVYSKKSAMELVRKVAPGIRNRSFEALSNQLWEGLNSYTTIDDRRQFAEDMAEIFVDRMTVDTLVKHSEWEDAVEKMAYLKTGIGTIDFRDQDASELKYKLDKKYMSFRGRWGYRKNGDGSFKRAYGLDEFISDLSREMPGMEYLAEMHPVDALMEVDKLYTDLQEQIKEKYEGAYDELSTEEFDEIKRSIAIEIMNAYNNLGEKTKIAKYLDNKFEEYRARIDFWKAENAKTKKVARWHGIISTKALHIRELKKGAFYNATQHHQDIFKDSIEKLANIQWRGNLKPTQRVSEIFADLKQWYTMDNPMLFKRDSEDNLYSDTIATYITKIAESKGAFTEDTYAMVYEVMNHLYTMMRNYNKVFRNGRWEDAPDLVEKYLKIMEETKKNRSLVRRLQDGYNTEFLEPMAVAKRADNYNENGFFTQTMEDLRRASINASVGEMNLRKEYDAFVDKNKKYLSNAAKETVRYRDHDIPKIHLIGLYMTMKREHARAGLALNGFEYAIKNKWWDSEDHVYVKGYVTAGDNVTQEMINEATFTEMRTIEKSFTDVDKQYIKVLEKLFNEDLKRLKVERDMERQGYTNATLDYYYPIMRGAMAENIDTAKISDQNRATNASFNKNTVKGAKQRLVIISADAMVNRHINDMCKYYYMSQAIENYNVLYNCDVSGNANDPMNIARLVKETKIWEKDVQYFKKLVSDMQGIRDPQTTAEKALEALRGNYAAFALGLNLKVLFTQFSSMIAAGDVIGFGSILSPKALKVTSADIDTYCPLAAVRNYDAAVIKAMSVSDKVGKVSKALTWGIGKVDRLVVRRLFAACQVEAEKRGSGKIGTEENKIAAGKLLEQVIIETQQNSYATERSQAMRSKNEFLKAVTMFTADGMKIVSRMHEAYGEMKAARKSGDKAKLKKARRKFARSVAVAVNIAVYMTAIACLFNWIYDRDDEEEDENKMLSLTMDTIGNFISALPILSDLYDFMVDGFEVESPMMDTVNNIFSGINNIRKDAVSIIKRDGERSTQDINRDLRTLLYGVGQATGIPFRNAYNLARGAIGHFTRTGGYKLDSKFYETSLASDLEDAIEKGDNYKASYVMALIYDERVDKDVPQSQINEIVRLSKLDYSVLPKTIPDKVTKNGKTYNLTASQKDAISSEYAKVTAEIDKLISSTFYRKLSDKDKAYMIDYYHDKYYEMAVNKALKFTNKDTIVSGILGFGKYAEIKFVTKDIESDKDDDGKAIAGSKKEKVIEALNKTTLSTENKLLYLASLGYALTDAEKTKLVKYLNSLKLSTSTKQKLADMCGLGYKNGKITSKS